MTAKVLFTGKTHTTNGRDACARSADGFLDLRLHQPHPQAENLFGAAWSACYMGAVELAASRGKIKLPSGLSVDAEINLNIDGNSFFLKARLKVSIPGVDHDIASELIQAAHEICPYSKAVRGNIAVHTELA